MIKPNDEVVNISFTHDDFGVLEYETLLRKAYGLESNAPFGMVDRCHKPSVDADFFEIENLNEIKEEVVNAIEKISKHYGLMDPKIIQIIQNVKNSNELRPIGEQIIQFNKLFK